MTSATQTSAKGTGRRRKRWVPNSMEQTCLTHLDRPGSWEMLKSTRPETDQRVGLWQLRVIFRFNFALFFVIFAALFILLAYGSGYSAEDYREDFLSGLVLTTTLAGAFAFYVLNLYRRTWNRRALSLQDD